MRQAFHEELSALTDSLVEMTNLVASAMSRATTALLDADLRLAESVISADETVDLLRHEVEERAFDVMARQAPVAGDLRLIVTSLRIVSDLERMGDLALHVAQVARRRYPASAVPPELRGTILEMGQVAQRIVAKAGSVIASRDVAMARELERDDDVMDSLHRQLFTVLLDEHWSHGMEAAIDITLCGRYYERYADHAVSVAHRVVYLVTGVPVHGHATGGSRVGHDRGDADGLTAPPPRPSRAASFALVGHLLRGGLRGRRVEIALLDDVQRVVELVDERDPRRDVERDDRLVGHAVQMLDQRPQRVAVCGDQGHPALQQIRDDAVVPVRQHPDHDVLQAFRLRQDVRAQGSGNARRSRSAGRVSAAAAGRNTTGATS